MPICLLGLLSPLSASRAFLGCRRKGSFGEEVDGVLPRPDASKRRSWIHSKAGSGSGDQTLLQIIGRERKRCGGERSWLRRSNDWFVGTRTRTRQNMFQGRCLRNPLTRQHLVRGDRKPFSKRGQNRSVVKRCICVRSKDRSCLNPRGHKNSRHSHSKPIEVKAI
jgi:hypothetical protein